jgi:hypothetical protein
MPAQSATNGVATDASATNARIGKGTRTSMPASDTQ